MSLLVKNCPDLTGLGVVAVSGGADSVALLRFLASQTVHLIVAHINHQLRGPDSDADAAFVRDLADSLGLSNVSVTIDIAAEALSKRANMEATARRLRYDWLERIAIERGAAWIATGHTADDQAETILHRIIRGTGIQGLRGIARERPLQPSLRLIRPLLAITRTDVVAFLNALRQTWREDASNRDRNFTRNRIRHELLPLLRSFNPSIAEGLNRLAEQATEMHDERTASAEKLLKEAELPRAGTVRIFETSILRAHPPARLPEVFRLVWEREGWPMRKMTFEHWQRLGSIVRGELTAADFPGGLSVRRREKVIQIGRAEGPSEPEA